MNKKLIGALDELLTLESGSTSFSKTEILSDLIETEYIVEDLRPPQSCPLLEDCRAFCECKRDGSDLVVKCDEGHEGRIPVEDHLYYDVS